MLVQRPLLVEEQELGVTFSELFLVHSTHRAYMHLPVVGGVQVFAETDTFFANTPVDAELASISSPTA